MHAMHIQGDRYWEGERRLCAAMLAAGAVPSHPQPQRPPAQTGARPSSTAVTFTINEVGVADCHHRHAAIVAAAAVIAATY